MISTDTNIKRAAYRLPTDPVRTYFGNLHPMNITKGHVVHVHVASTDIRVMTGKDRQVYVFYKMRIQNYW